MSLVVWPVCRYRLMVRICCAVTGYGIGSEMARAPFGMVKLVCPPDQVTWARESVLMDDVPAEPFKGTAIVADVIGRSDAPNALEMTSRIVGADCVMKIVCRRVAFSKTSPDWF